MRDDTRSGLQIDLRELRDSAAKTFVAVVIDCVGDLDMDTEPVFRRYVENVFATYVPRVSTFPTAAVPRLVINLTGIDFFDSSALQVLVGMYQRLQWLGENRDRLCIIAPDGGFVRRILRLTRIDTCIPVISTEAEIADGALPPAL